MDNLALQNDKTVGGGEFERRRRGKKEREGRREREGGSMIVLTSAQEGGDGDGAFRPTTPPFASPFSSYFARFARRPGGEGHRKKERFNRRKKYRRRRPCGNSISRRLGPRPPPPLLRRSIIIPSCSLLSQLSRATVPLRPSRDANLDLLHLSPAQGD